MPLPLFGLVVVAVVLVAWIGGAAVHGNIGWIVVIALAALLAPTATIRYSQRDLFAFRSESGRWPTEDELAAWNQEMHGRREKARRVGNAEAAVRAAEKAYHQRLAVAERTLNDARAQHSQAITAANQRLAAAEAARRHAVATAKASLAAWQNPGLGARIASFQTIQLHAHGLVTRQGTLPVLHATAKVEKNKLVLDADGKHHVIKLKKDEVPTAAAFASQVRAAAAAEAEFERQRPGAIPAAKVQLAKATRNTGDIEAARVAVSAATGDHALLAAIADAEEGLEREKANTADVDQARSVLSAAKASAIEHREDAPPPTWTPRASNAGHALVALVLIAGIVTGTGAVVTAPSSSVASATSSSTPTPESSPSTPSTPAATPTPTPLLTLTPTPLPTPPPTAVPAPPRPPTAPPPVPAPAPTAAAPAGCYPLSNSGTCYRPGEFCRASDHGMTGRTATGEAIVCQYNNGWRWEPA